MTIEIIDTMFFRGNKIDVFKINDKKYYLIDQIVSALGYTQIEVVYLIIKKEKKKFETREFIKINKDDIYLADLLSSDINSNDSYYYFVDEHGLKKIIDIVTESYWLDKRFV